MIMAQSITDKIAIGLSLLCTLHCVALPVLLLMLPSLTALNINSELFHIGMIVAVVPISFYALFRGFQQHRRSLIPAVAIAGLMLLVLALLLEESLGESGEMVLTLSGSALVAFGHFRNFSHCSREANASCAKE